MKALIKVGEIVKLLYETSKGLKIYCTGDNYLFVRIMFQLERRAVLKKEMMHNTDTLINIIKDLS